MKRKTKYLYNGDTQYQHLHCLEGFSGETMKTKNDPDSGRECYWILTEIEYLYRKSDMSRIFIS